MEKDTNSTPSDTDFTKALINKFLSANNNSVLVLYNTSLIDYDDIEGGERGIADRLWVCIFIGVFLSVCAVISLLVLLYVFCTQRTTLWPFARSEATTGSPIGSDKEQALCASSPEVAAEEGRMGGPPAEQQGLLVASDDLQKQQQKQQQPDGQSRALAAITASTSSSSDSETEPRPKAP